MARAQTMTLPLELRNLFAGCAAAEVSEDQRWILALLRKDGLTVLSLLWRMLGAEADVLDAYQTAVCRLAAHGREEIGRNPSGYLYRTAVNVAIETLRARKLRQTHWPQVVAAECGRVQAPPGPTEVFDQRVASEELRAAICKLPPYLRSVIVLRDLAEMSYREVARVLGIRSGTARLYRRQAIVRLAELIGEETES